MEKPSAVVVKLPQCFDAKGARRLRHDIAHKMAGNSPAVILDMSRLQRMDVEGLDALVEVLGEVARRDGSLQLSEVSPEAATLLELTRVAPLLEKFPTVSIEAPAVTFSPEQVPSEERPVQLPAVA